MFILPILFAGSKFFGRNSSRGKRRNRGKKSSGYSAHAAGENQNIIEEIALAESAEIAEKKFQRTLRTLRDKIKTS